MRISCRWVFWIFFSLLLLFGKTRHYIRCAQRCHSLAPADRQRESEWLVVFFFPRWSSRPWKRHWKNNHNDNNNNIQLSLFSDCLFAGRSRVFFISFVSVCLLNSSTWRYRAVCRCVGEYKYLYIYILYIFFPLLLALASCDCRVLKRSWCAWRCVTEMRATASRSRARRSPASRYNENWRDPGEKYDIAIPWRPSTKSHQQVFIFFIFKRKRRRIRRARSEFFRPNFFTLTLSVSLGTLTMSIRVACLNALMSSLLSLDYLILSSFFFSPSSVADSSKSFCQRMDWETVGSACFGGCWLSKTISSLLSLYLAVSVHLFISVIHLIIACLFRQQIMFFAGKRGTKKLCF